MNTVTKGALAAALSLTLAWPAAAQTNVVVWVGGEPGQATVYDTVAE